MNKVGIIQTKTSNIFSLIRYLEYNNVEYKIIDDANDIKNFGHLIIPGVGSFGSAMKYLKLTNTIEKLNDFVKNGKYLLGICLGAQLLLEQSEEFGYHDGLGYIAGQVIKIPDKKLRVPHVGWSKLIKSKSWENSVLSKTNENLENFYFTHSYYCNANKESILAEFQYFNLKLVAAVQLNNVIGVQFHPELSSSNGRNIFLNFLNLS